jgi:predicted homoserine dehydrogenase-like protein
VAGGAAAQCFTPEQVAGGGFNPQMFNSFLDGTKSALEMAAASNACGLKPPADGLSSSQQCTNRTHRARAGHIRREHRHAR